MCFCRRSMIDLSTIPGSFHPISPWLGGLGVAQPLVTNPEVPLVNPAPCNKDVGDPLRRAKSKCMSEETQVLLRVFELGMPSELVTHHPTNSPHLHSHIQTTVPQTHGGIGDLFANLVGPVKIPVLQNNVGAHSERLNLCRRVASEAEVAEEVQNDFNVFVSFAVA